MDSRPQQQSRTSLNFFAPAATHTENCEELTEIDIPADVDSLYMCVFIGYLLPVINAPITFKDRVLKCIGSWGDSRELIKESERLRNHIILHYNNVSRLNIPPIKKFITAFRNTLEMHAGTAGSEDIIVTLRRRLRVPINILPVLVQM